MILKHPHSGAAPAAPVAAVKARSGIQSVEVGSALLQVLAQGKGAWMLRDLAAQAGMPAAKAHRYLVSLQRQGLVVQDSCSMRYDLGPTALQLGLAALARLDPIRLARERVPALAQALGHTVALAVWGNHGPTIVHWQESPRSLNAHLRLGDVMPLLSSATGRCFAAHLPPVALAEPLQAELQAAQQQQRSDLPRSSEELAALLDEVRQQGLARVMHSLLPGIHGLCAPVFDADGHLALGLLSLGPAARFDPDWQGLPAQLLRQTARQLSHDLGWTGASQSSS